VREYISKKLIVETLKAKPNQAFTARELTQITEIPFATLKGQLKDLVHAGVVQKKTLQVQRLNKRGTQKFEQPQVWYFSGDING